MDESQAGQPCATPPAELRRLKRECWDTTCHATAWVRDWAGWQWCPRHALTLGGGWAKLRWMRLRWPY